MRHIPGFVRSFEFRSAKGGKTLLRRKLFLGFRICFFQGRLSGSEGNVEGRMAREVQLFAVSLVFVFLGAIVFGLIH